MAERTEILVCQLAEYSIGDDNAVEAHLILPGGDKPLRCKIWPPKYPSEKGAKDAILAFQSGQFKRGEYYSTTIKFKPAPNSGEYRNILSMTTSAQTAPVATPAQAGTSTTAGTGRRDPAGRSIERQVAAKAATEILVAQLGSALGGTAALNDGAAVWENWANHIIDWIQEAHASPIFEGVAEMVAEADVIAQAAVMAEVVQEATANDYAVPAPPAPAEDWHEESKVAVLEAAGGDRQKVGLAIQEMGFDSFTDMTLEQVNALLLKLSSQTAHPAPPTAPF